MLDKIKRRIATDGEHPLWTRAYIILTAGSIISYMGNSAMNFVMSLMVLDFSKSVLLYSFYLVAYRLVKILTPILIGPYLDRYSRKRMIYTMDFCAAAVYLMYFIMIRSDQFVFVVLMIGNIMLGVIDSIYRVSYTSLFPMIVHKDNLQRAYSVSSMLETISYAIVPISAFFYKYIGAEKILFVGIVIFVIAAITECFIIVDESKQNNEKATGAKQYLHDLKGGLLYVKRKKGLLLIVGFVIFYYFSTGVQDTVWLPFFNDQSTHGYFWYMIITGAAMAGNFMGGMILFLFKTKNRIKYILCFLFLGIIVAGNSLALIVPHLLACVLMYVYGISTVALNNIRTTGVYGYVDNEHRGRYAGISHMAINVGKISGQIMAGVLSLSIPLQIINVSGSGILLVGGILTLLILGRKSVKYLLNQEYENEVNTDWQA